MMSELSRGTSHLDIQSIEPNTIAGFQFWCGGLMMVVVHGILVFGLSECCLSLFDSLGYPCQGMLYAFLYLVCRATRTLRSSLSSTVHVPDSPFHLFSSVVSLPFVYIASGLLSSLLLYSVSSTHCPGLCNNQLCSLMYKYFVRWALTAHLDITSIPRSNALALFLSSRALTHNRKLQVLNL
jgi:hypothetical protein